MVEFPRSAYFGKRIPFAQLRRQGLAACFGKHIKSLVWAYKLSPETVRLAATEHIREIEVMDLAVKDSCSGTKVLAGVITALDKFIPSPLIFRIFDEEGTPLKVAFNLKPSGGAPRGESDLFRLFQSTEEVALPMGALNLETFYKAFAAAVGGLTTTADESLRELEARHYHLEAIAAVMRVIEIYNTRRLHEKLGYKTPAAYREEMAKAA